MGATVGSSAFSDFPSTFKGSVYRPGDPGYDEVKLLWNRRRSDQLPALIAQATDPDDVVIAVDYAVGSDVSIGVRSGGHGIDCSAMPHDALVVDMSLMKRVTVDPATGRTTIQSGVLLGEMDAATQQHGYVVPAGTVTETGAAGLTLGGGIGHLTRRFGATVDNLLSVDVVTVDGRKLTASNDENEELFWGLRGAGHNLAIATSFTFQAQRVGPDVFSGPLVYAPADAVAVLAGLDDAMSRTPRELSFTPTVQPAPPLPGMPEDLIGQPVVLATVVYTGRMEHFESAMSAIRRLPAPIVDMVGPTSWLQANSMIDAMAPAGRRQHNGGGYLSAITEDVAQILLEGIADSPPATGPGVSCAVALPGLGGALHDFAEDSTAFSRAGAMWLYEVMAQWDPQTADEEHLAWIDATVAKLAPHSLTNGYINLTADRGSDWLQGVYGTPEKWQRILELKQTWDPDNRFCHNKNITPVATAA